MIIDAKDTIMGRLAAFAAKKALEGNKVDIINCEKAIITGDKANIIEYYSHQRGRGGPYHGPYISRQPYFLLRRVIRGMLPHKQARGREAYERIKCHLGIPEEFSGKKAEVLEKSNVSRLKTAKYMSLGQLSQSMGAKLR